MSVLFFQTMHYSVEEPRSPSNDRFVLSKGHAAPVLYAAWAEAGLFPISDLLNLRKLSSDLEGHPTPVSVVFFPCCLFLKDLIVISVFPFYMTNCNWKIAAG